MMVAVAWYTAVHKPKQNAKIYHITTGGLNPFTWGEMGECFMVIYMVLQSRLAIMRLAITRIGYNAVGRGPRISAARGEMGATANNNAVINCHLFL